jgi:hypothetical protein
MLFFSEVSRIFPSKINERESAKPNKTFSFFFSFINVDRKQIRKTMAMIIREKRLKSMYRAEIIPAHKGVIIRINGISLCRAISDYNAP